MKRPLIRRLPKSKLPLQRLSNKALSSELARITRRINQITDLHERASKAQRNHSRKFFDHANDPDIKKAARIREKQHKLTERANELARQWGISQSQAAKIKRILSSRAQKR